ncbi:hypothetical protein IAU59_005479 [Kwoniella sp. CBS 9459]
MSEPYDPSPSDTRSCTATSKQTDAAGLASRQELLGGRRDSASQLQSQSHSLTSNSSRHPSPDELDPQRAKMNAINAEIDQTKHILHQNIESIVERGQRLDHLDQQTQVLSVSAKTFNTQAGKTRRQFWWKDKKWTIIIAVVVILIICGIIGGAVKGSEK